MALAFVLINVELGKEKEVLDQLRSIDSVKEVNLVYGVYDIVVKVEADTTDKLKEIVTYKIRKLADIRSTLTMTVAEGI